jgi:hypothetical protein
VSALEPPYNSSNFDFAAVMSPGGRAMVMSQVRSTSSGVLPTLKVATTQQDGSWAPAVTFDMPASGQLGLFTGAFDSSDAPAVLWTQASATDTIHFRKRGPAGWESVQTLRSNITLLGSNFNGSRILQSTLRLLPRPNENWLAVWDETSALVAANYD